MSERPALFLLPGLLCDRSVWTYQEQALSRDADVTVANFYGFDSLGGMAQSVLEQAPERFAVAGHSMGGRVALEIVRRAPERVARLAVLDTGTHPKRPGEAEKRQVLVDLARREGMEALARQWLPPMVHPDRLNDAPMMRALTEMVCRATPEIFERQVRALLGRPDFGPLLPTIKCPTLVACGRQDAWSPLDQHEAIAAAIPSATLAVIEDSGHMTTVEAPAAVTGFLQAWLRV
ncbi:MAG TPA: alpha/beta hydrolase [Stellaceae bacterium]